MIRVSKWYFIAVIEYREEFREYAAGDENLSEVNKSQYTTKNYIYTHVTNLHPTSLHLFARQNGERALGTASPHNQKFARWRQLSTESAPPAMLHRPDGVFVYYGAAYVAARCALCHACPRPLCFLICSACASLIILFQLRYFASCLGVFKFLGTNF